MAEESEDEYDLLTVIMIRQGKEPEENGIFEYLNGIFDGDINRIQKYSHIKWSEPFQKEASKMTDEKIDYMAKVIKEAVNQ